MTRLFPRLALLVCLLLGSSWCRADDIFVSASASGFSSFTNTVVKIDSNGTQTVFANTGLNDPHGLAFDTSGDLYVANVVSGQIVKLNPSGTPSVFVNSGLAQPIGIAFDRGGNLYVANFPSNTIVKIDSGGNETVFARTGLSNPYGLAFDNRGNLFVSNFGNNTVEKFDASGTGTLFANTGVNQPHGLAFDTDGNLYVANAGNNTIEKFNACGDGTLFANTGLNNPIGLAFNSSGTLFAANANGDSIEEFNTSGQGSLFASLAFSPRFIAVPAPSMCPNIVGTWSGQMNVAAFGGYSTIPLSIQVTDQRANGCLVRGWLTQGSASNCFPNLRFGWNPWFRVPFTGTIPDGSTVLLNVGGDGSGKASAILDVTQTPPALTKFVYQPGNGNTLTGDLTLQPPSH